MGRSTTIPMPPQTNLGTEVGNEIIKNVHLPGFGRQLLVELGAGATASAG